MKLSAMILVFILSLSLWASPQISSVNVRSRHPVSDLVDVEFVLADADGPVDIAFSAYDGDNRLEIPPAALSGDLCGVTSGTRTITLDLAKAGYETGLAALRAVVEPVAAKTYMIVDLQTGEIAYSESVVGTSERWDDEYKQSKLVLRRCPAGSFVMGSPIDELGRQSTPTSYLPYNELQGGVYKDTREKQHLVKISKPFYIGVYEVTQRQLQYLFDNDRQKILAMTYFTNETCYARRPVDHVNYSQICGATLGAKFPNGNEVDEGSILYKLRQLTGVNFELPTEAQWEYAARAASETAYYNGAATIENARLIGCCGRGQVPEQSRNCDTVSGTCEVGQFEPNAWGLFDTCGNVMEWTRDWATFIVREEYQVDPTVPEEERFKWDWRPYSRSLRGGAYNSSGVSESRSSARGQNTPGVTTEIYGRFGFRLAAPVSYEEAREKPSVTGPCVSDVKIVSRWPWEAKVDVYFGVSGVEDVVDIDVQAVSSTGERLVIRRESLGGDYLGIGNGFHKLTWDVSQSDYVSRGHLNGVTFSLTPEKAKTYMICDLETSEITYSDRVIGAGEVWGDYYKTRAIVLRRCPAGRFTMGSPENETYRQKTPNTTALSSDDTREKQHQVRISQPYYIGVFPMTQGQFELLFDKVKRLEWSWCTNELVHATRPMDRLSYRCWRGAEKGARYPIDDEVDAGSLLAALRSRFGVRFDLPSEAQWEYAYRAGTTTAFYNGGIPGGDQSTYLAFAREIGQIGGTVPSASNRNCDLTQGTKPVGSYLANPWGLYDMAGGVWECTRDYAKLKVTATHEVDPVNAKADAWTSTARSTRGGAMGDVDPSNFRAAARGQMEPNNPYNLLVGGRVCAPLPY